MKRIIMLFCLIFNYFTSDSHDERAHQWFVKMGFEYLQSRYTCNPLDLNIIKNQVYNTTQYKTWNVSKGAITAGANNEDFQNAVYNHSGWFDAQVTCDHFFNSDSYSKDHVYTLNLFCPAGTQNAWTKFRAYLFNPNDYGAMINVNDGEGYYIENGVTKMYYGGIKIIYNNLIEFYKTGYCNYIQHSAGYASGVHIKSPYKEAIAFQILGRACHLLQDMSVPAHVHLDSHIPFFPINDEDSYETYIKNFFLGINNWNTIEQLVIQGESIENNYENISGVGEVGFFRNIDRFYSDMALFENIFFTNLEIADYFGSNDIEGDEDLIHQVAPSNYYLNLKINDYISNSVSHVIPNENKFVYYNTIAKNTLAYLIRTTATLIYWFGVRTEILKKIPTGNNDCFCENTSFNPPSIIETQVFGGDHLNKDITIQPPYGKLLLWNNDLIVCNNSTITNNNEIQIGENNYTPNRNLIVESGSKIELYEGPSSYNGMKVFRNGELRMKHGSTLIIHQNASLEVKDGGGVILEPGSTLIIEPGAQIILNGDNAILDIGGKLILQDNATFTFTGSGHIVYRTPYLGPPQIVAGNNCKIELNGSGQQDLVLKVEAGGLFWTPDNLQKYTVTNAMVVINNQLSLGSPYLFENVKFSGGNIYTWGTSNSLFNNCEISSGIIGRSSVFGNNLVINNSNINYFGINTEGRGIILGNNNFNNCFEAITITGADANSVIANCNFNGNSICNSAITYDASSNASLMVKNSVISNYELGIESYGGSTYLFRNSISNCNAVGLSSYNNNQLYLSSFTPLAGQNQIVNNGQSPYPLYSNIFLKNSKPPVLDYGFNNLYKKVSYSNNTSVPINYLTFQGTINSGGRCNINARGNYWSTTNTNALIQVSEENVCTNVTFNICNPISGTIPGSVPFPPPGSILSVCTTCPRITTTSFNDVPLNEAVLTAMSLMEDIDSTKNDLAAVQLFYEILKQPIDSSSPEQLELYDMAYTGIRTAMAGAFTRNRISRSDNLTVLHPQVVQLMDIYNRLSTPPNTKNYLTQFYTDMGKSQLMRTAGRYDDALIILDTLNKCFLEEEQLRELKNWKIVTTAEKKVISGEVSYMKFDSLLAGYEKLVRHHQPNQIDTTTQIDGTVKMGTNVRIGSNTKIEKDVII